MQLSRAVKTALDENRLLILGAQIFLGFQFHAVFQERFDELPAFAKVVQGASLSLLVITIVLLIAPSMRHRLVEKGEDSHDILRYATRCAGGALPPFAGALAADAFIGINQVLAWPWALFAALVFLFAALMCWYASGLILGQRSRRIDMTKSSNSTPIDKQIEQLLTESRVVIPGAQALLGFQLIVTLTSAFEKLPSQLKVCHVAALCCLTLCVILLLAPAAIHRIAYAGEDDPEFLKIGSALVIFAAFPLACAICLDTYIASYRCFGSAPAIWIGAAAFLVVMWTWYAYPFFSRSESARHHGGLLKRK